MLAFLGGGRPTKSAQIVTDLRDYRRGPRREEIPPVACLADLDAGMPRERSLQKPIAWSSRSSDSVPSAHWPRSSEIRHSADFDAAARKCRAHHHEEVCDAGCRQQAAQTTAPARPVRRHQEAAYHRASNHWLWALGCERYAENPDGFHVWTDQEVARFEAHHAIASRLCWRSARAVHRRWPAERAQQPHQLPPRQDWRRCRPAYLGRKVRSAGSAAKAPPAVPDPQRRPPVQW